MWLVLGSYSEVNIVGFFQLIELIRQIQVDKLINEKKESSTHVTLITLNGPHLNIKKKKNVSTSSSSRWLEW